jgi:GT2 family glycosyltransferase
MNHIEKPLNFTAGTLPQNPRDRSSLSGGRIAGTENPVISETHVDRNPAVSVIIPAYNTARYIGEAIDSVLAQTYSDYEIIVINDGSEDTEELERVLAAYTGRIVYLEQENRGSSAARNAGLRVARGRYIALLDSDDVWEPEYLAVHVETLERDPSVDIVFPNARLFGNTTLEGKTYMDMVPVEGEVTFVRLISGRCNVWGGVTARREAFVRAGGFDEELGTAEDLDLWLRVLRQGGHITYHRRVLAHYRKRDGSHTSQPVVLWLNFLKLLGKLDKLPDLTDAERAVIEESRLYTLARLRVHEGKQAILAGDTATAMRRFSEVNALRRNRRIGLLLALLRVAPAFVAAIYRLRTRLFGE